MGNVGTKWVVNFLLGWVPDLFLCWAYMTVTDGGQKEFFLAFFFLQALYFFFWFKQAAWSWLLFWAYGKASLSRHLEKFLREGQFPAPRSFDGDIHDYLNGVVEDEQIACDTRIKAAFELGTINGFRTTGNLSLVMKVFSASKTALDRYSRYAPRRPADAH